jgi:hypothetical protein
VDRDKVFSDEKMEVRQSWRILMSRWVERLVWIKENTEGLIPMKIDLWEVVGCRRSMRRGATIEALNIEVDASWIDTNNGWRKFERAQGKMPSMLMRQLYTEMLQNLKHELKFSLAI